MEDRRPNKMVVFTRESGSSYHFLSKREKYTGALAIYEVKHIVLEFF